MTLLARIGSRETWTVNMNIGSHPQSGLSDWAVVPREVEESPKSTH